MASRKRKYKKASSDTPELNVMPFIDIFSMLNTFLLVSASFIGLGILEVQVPFVSSASSPSDDKPTRTLSVKVEVETDQITLKTSWSEAPEDPKSKDYPLNPEGIEKLHQDLIELKTQEPKSDKVTLMTDDDVKYDQMILVLDAIKTLKETDPDLPQEADTPNTSSKLGRFLYQKVVLGSVIL